MEIAEFEFKKERKIGEFIQDFVNLLKIISPHLIKVMLRMLIVPIGVMVLVVYYISTQINTGIGDEHMLGLIQDVVLAVLLLLVVGLFGFGLAIEYFVLLRDKRTLDFGSKDVFRAFIAHLGKYFSFLFVAILVGILAFIPVSIVAVMAMFIPFIGSFAVGIFITMLTIWYFAAFMLYREGYDNGWSAFGLAFNMLKKQIFTYGVATYVIHFIYQSILMLMTIVPIVFFFVVGYNSGSFSAMFFETLYGRLLISVGGSILTVVSLMYYVLSVLSYGIVYETAKELKFGESIFERIQRLGREDSDD